MCGFCTESAAFRHLLDAMKGDPAEPRDSLLYPIYLQETPLWRTELRLWASVDHPRGDLVALCRQWSERLVGKDAQPLEDVLAAHALTGLQKWLATLDYPQEWRWALCIDGYPPAPLPLELAEARLDAYIEGWLQPSPPEATSWDQKALYEGFLSVSLAFDIVAKCAADDARLMVLATCPPNRTPFFNGLDLWLQRRALYACVARSGVSFIKAHLDELRIESILSVVMSDLLSKSDLVELHASMQGCLLDSLEFGSDELLDALEKKAKPLTQPSPPPP